MRVELGSYSYFHSSQYTFFRPKANTKPRIVKSTLKSWSLGVREN